MEHGVRPSRNIGETVESLIRSSNTPFGTHARHPQLFTLDFDLLFDLDLAYGPEIKLLCLMLLPLMLLLLYGWLSWDASTDAWERAYVRNWTVMQLGSRAADVSGRGAGREEERKTDPWGQVPDAGAAGGGDPAPGGTSPETGGCQVTKAGLACWTWMTLLLGFAALSMLLVGLILSCQQ